MNRDDFHNACTGFGRTLAHATPDDLAGPTVCTGWDVRALVNHVVGENRWTPPLLAGKTIADVGDALDGDLLGEDPYDSWRRSADEAMAAVDGLDSSEQIVHLSFGDVPAAFYLDQLTADQLVHTWDLARAIGADEHLDEHLVEVVSTWFADHEDAYRGAGAIAERAPIPAGAGPQTVLLAKFGRAG